MPQLATVPPAPPTTTLRQLPILGDEFRLAFEQAAAGISVVAPSGEYLHANQAFCEFVGYSLDQLRSMSFRSLLHPDDRVRSNDLVDRMLRGDLSEARWERRF